LVAGSAVSAQNAAMQAPSPGDASLALGRRLFSSGATPACSICHTLKDASATGEVGPSLDQIRPDAGRVAKALRHGVGAMPSYRERLTDDQIEALALYVSHAAGD
jgi:sulfite dehydrogenase